MKNWKPFPKQELALSFSYKTVFEILFGGARGPGKTDCGMVWLLGEQFDEDKFYIQHPEYRALVLRKNYKDLTDWLDRAGRMYQKLGVNITGNPATITFPSGALIRCGHLRDKKSYQHYLGHEYHRILIEELTQIKKEKYYVQILGSCRSINPQLGPQVFATTNPGGPGHSWVRKRFVSPDPQRTTTIGKREGVEVFKFDNDRPRVFIPATLDDNPIILKEDEGYVDYLESIKSTDKALYRAWRHGDWSVFSGQVFSEFRPYKHVIDPVTPDSDDLTHVIWIDWGYSKESAFAGYVSAIKQETNQRGDKFNRIITYKEFWGNQKSPEVWADIIFDFFSENNIQPSRAVSDPAMHSTQQSGATSIADIMEKRWRELNDNRPWCRIEPGSNRGRNSRVNRVGMMHNWLSDGPGGLPYWVMTKNCKNLIRTLPELVFDENLVEAYDTDQEDHCLHPDTVVITYKGRKKIKDIVGKSGKILSVNGEWADYHDVRLTRKNAELVEVTFEDGHTLKCTPDHKILTPQGMIEAQHLMGRRCLSVSYQTPSKSLTESDTTYVENTTSGVEIVFIEWCMSIISEILNLALTFITRITIGATTILKTLLRWMYTATYHITQASKMQTTTTLRKSEKWPVNGTNQQKDESGIKNTMRRWLTSYTRKDIQGFVTSVTRASKPVLRTLDFVNQLAVLSIDVHQGKMTLKKHVLYADQYLPLTNTTRRLLVQDRALTKCVGVKKIKERIDTYDLTVDKWHAFTIDNGVIVSNSADSCSYGLEKVKFISVKPGDLNLKPEESKHSQYWITNERGQDIIDPNILFNVN